MKISFHFHYHKNSFKQSKYHIFPKNRAGAGYFRLYSTMKILLVGNTTILSSEIKTLKLNPKDITHFRIPFSNKLDLFFTKLEVSANKCTIRS